MLILHLLAQPGLPDPGLAIDQGNAASSSCSVGQRLAQLPEHLRPANKRRGYHTDTPRLEGQLTSAGQRGPATLYVRGQQHLIHLEIPPLVHEPGLFRLQGEGYAVLVTALG